MYEHRAHEYMTEDELFAEFGKGPGHGMKNSPERTYKLHLDNKVKYRTNIATPAAAVAAAVSPSLAWPKSILIQPHPLFRVD